jgi:N-acetylglucosaminyldiphosphoundecaprenol N-acetyl-beta-D-mannosaminyltransferase
MENRMLDKFHPILGIRINALSWDDAIDRIAAWGNARESRYICICNVHSIVTATRDPEFKMIVNNADMATPDGAPVAWALRRFGYVDQERINGPDLMWCYLHKAERSGQVVYFYGSTESTLEKLLKIVSTQFPRLRVGGACSPPFHSLSKQEDEAEVTAINRSGAHVVFVGLGCPKQERWMAAHCGRIRAVMVGVGAAFDYHSGVLKRAPLSWQRYGLEWLYRLCLEPRRLFKRYLVTNTLFILGISRQLLRNRISER